MKWPTDFWSWVIWLFALWFLGMFVWIVLCGIWDWAGRDLTKEIKQWFHDSDWSKWE
jgi:hypothetical protein